MAEPGKSQNAAEIMIPCDYLWKTAGKYSARWREEQGRREGQEKLRRDMDLEKRRQRGRGRDGWRGRWRRGMDEWRDGREGCVEG